MIASDLISVLKSKNLTISTAESCTGGLIGYKITEIPGASDVYLGGVISYSNDVKETVLGVSHETLVSFGAVSEETALEMVEGARFTFSSDVAIAVTGIAGPGGEVPGKPVGLVYISVLTPKGTVVEKNIFSGNREEVRNSAANRAMEIVLEELQ